MLHNAFPARQWQPFIALQINTRDAAAAWCAGMECGICVGEIANPAVCSKRATLLGNVDRANRKAAVRAELTKRLDVKSVSGRGRSSQYHSRILDRWAANMAALKGATGENAVPFPGAAR